MTIRICGDVGMVKYRLGDICEIVSGSTPKTGVSEYWDGDKKWITPAEITDESYIITDSVRKLTELGVTKTGLSSFPKGTVILSSRAPIGKVAIAGCEMYCNQGFKNLICSQKIYNRYLYWFLKGNTEYLNSLGRGATFKEISKQIVASIEINVPDMGQQMQAAENLERVSSIIRLRKQELQKLDDLVKARFVELFGDPISNPKGWKKDKAESHIDLLSGYPFQSEQYVNDGINICGGLIIMPQKIQWQDCRHWPSVDGYEDYLLAEDDIVMALDRPWISEGFKIAQVDSTHLPALLIQRTARIRGIDVNQQYLFHCFVNGGFDKHSNVTGSLVPHISAKDIRSFEILLPPIKLQKQFAAFVKQVDKSKAVIQKALDEAQLLFDSLMQKYFG